MNRMWLHHSNYCKGDDDDADGDAAVNESENDEDLVVAVVDDGTSQMVARVICFLSLFWPFHHSPLLLTASVAAVVHSGPHEILCLSSIHLVSDQFPHHSDDYDDVDRYSITPYHYDDSPDRLNCCGNL